MDAQEDLLLTLLAVEDLLDEPHGHVALLVEEDVVVDGEEEVDGVLGRQLLLELVDVDLGCLHHGITLSRNANYNHNQRIFAGVDTMAVKTASLAVNHCCASYAGDSESRRGFLEMDIRFEELTVKNGQAD